MTTNNLGNLILNTRYTTQKHVCDCQNCISGRDDCVEVCSLCMSSSPGDINKLSLYNYIFYIMVLFFLYTDCILLNERVYVSRKKNNGHRRHKSLGFFFRLE